MISLRFGEVDFGINPWYRERTSSFAVKTKTYYRLSCTKESKVAGYVYVMCDGYKGRGNWFIKFFGGVRILNTIQNPGSTPVYYATSTLACQAAKALILKMDSLQAFI